jgi:poly-beta-1,6-N-acetyl-D-glucosamine synthase
MPWWALAILVFGINFTLWGSVGLMRLADREIVCRVHRRKPPSYPDNVIAIHDDPAGRRARQINLTVDDVAILIPAHNEAAVIEDALRAIAKLVPLRNIHVISDGSTDDTFEIALRAGARALKTRRNVGKAGALQEAIHRFRLVERFPVVMLLDADTRVQPGYFEAALPLFDNLEIVAVAGCVRVDRRRMLSPVGNLLVGHRMRVYTIGQRFVKFGQTSRRLNATPIVPGFASVYRTSVLPRIDMNPPGLAIEDFNMTFEVYQRGLGKVGFTLAAVAVTQDPDNFRDYIKQTRRWALGFWQTVRRHPPRLNLFTGMLTLSLIELVASCLMLILLPLVVIILVMPDLIGGAGAWPAFGPVHAFVAAHMSLRRVLFGVAIPDLALTLLVAAIERRPRLLLAAPFLPLVRVLDAAIGLYAVPLAWLVRSTGRWTSPARHEAPPAGEGAAAAALTALATGVAPAWAPDGEEAGQRHASG